jgi:hypothetical protein
MHPLSAGLWHAAASGHGDQDAATSAASNSAWLTASLAQMRRPVATYVATGLSVAGKTLWAADRDTGPGEHAFEFAKLLDDER